MGLIFISYRRDDTEQIAPRISERLEKRFGKRNIFIDVDSIPPGTDFRHVLEEALGKTDVLLAVIGKHWIESVQRRLDRDDDFVRFEIASALRREIRVIPLVIRGARIPTTQELPSDLEKLAFRNAMEISFDRDFDRDVRRLVQKLEDEGLASPNRWWPWWPRSRPAQPKTPAGGTLTAQDPRPDPPAATDLPPQRSRDSKKIPDTTSREAGLLQEQLRQRRAQFERAPSTVLLDSNGRPTSTRWFVRLGPLVTGPFGVEQLRSMRRRGDFSPVHQISIDRSRWESAQQLIEALDREPPVRHDGLQPSLSASSHVQGRPAAMSPTPSAAPAEWYYMDSSRRQVGPVPEQTLRELLRTRRLPRTTLAFKDGDAGWDLVTRRPELAPFVPSGSGRAPVVILVVCSVCMLLVILGWLFSR